MAQTRDPLALRKAQDDFARLQEELARVNAEIAELKRADRSVRGDYRLRSRMADAEALAQRLGRAEDRLRSLQEPPASQPKAIPLLPPPPESPQDGSVELEAKADLLADQASRLDQQADILARAAQQLRARKALRRRASAWDRDPFAGLEASKRSLAISMSTQKTAVGGATADSGSHGGTATTGGATPTGTPAPTAPTGGASPTAAPAPTATVATGGGANPTSATPTFTAPGSSSGDATARSSPAVGAIESPAAKSSPLAPGVASDRPSEQRLYLDPTTAAELRQALGAAGANSDPDALDRVATGLRVRARELGQRADTLRRKSRVP